MSKNIIISIIVVVLIIVGAWFFMSPKSSVPVVQDVGNTQPTNNENIITAENPDVKIEVGVLKNHEVVYTDSGFSPSNLNIKVGDTVIWKNQSSEGMWVGSAMHPSHIVYSGTDLKSHCPDTANTSFDECKSVASGESWSFTFTKAGSFGYHNHVNASKFGKIIVE